MPERGLARVFYREAWELWWHNTKRVLKLVHLGLVIAMLILAAYISLAELDWTPLRLD